MLIFERCGNIDFDVSRIICPAVLGLMVKAVKKSQKKKNPDIIRGCVAKPTFSVN